MKRHASTDHIFLDHDMILAELMWSLGPNNRLCTLSAAWKRKLQDTYVGFVLPELVNMQRIVHDSMLCAHRKMGQIQSTLYKELGDIQRISDLSKMSSIHLKAHKVQRYRLHRETDKEWNHRDMDMAPEWFQKHSNHSIYGRICPAISCDHTRLCKEVRQLDLIVGCDVKVSTGTMSFSIPDDTLHLVLECLFPDSILSLSQTSRDMYHRVESFEMFPVIQFENKLRQIAALKTKYDGSRLSKLSKSYVDYQHKCYMVQSLQNQVNEMKQEGQEMLWMVQERAATFFSISRAERESVLIPFLKAHDERLLFEYAIDSIGVVHGTDEMKALPPRAFWQGSKNRKSVRRQFTDLNMSVENAGGARLLNHLQVAQNDLVDGRKTLARTLRRMEGDFLKTVHTILEQVRDCPLLTSTFDSCFDGLT
nr:hypothetical protein [Gammaproteobacteria bacterium]